MDWLVAQAERLGHGGSSTGPSRRTLLARLDVTAVVADAAVGGR